jgi:hypothetical protein
VIRIVPIVEGNGEVEAVPILLRRITQAHSPGMALHVTKPIRVHRHRLLKPRELERTVELAARQGGSDGKILILLDADRDCPKHLAADVLQRAHTARSDRTIRVVLAKSEYEAWFIAAAASIQGHRGLTSPLTPPAEAESIRDAKGWLSARMPAGHSYRETLDQPALTAAFDLQAARKGAPSFDKMWRDVTSIL